MNPMAQEDRMPMPGATTVGIVCKDGVVLASERRFSYGYFVISKAAKKVFRLTDTIGAACAGLVADMQILVREVGSYTKIYSFERGRPSSVRTTAKVMGSLLFERRLFPYITQTIVGGIDEDGASLYVLDPIGSVIGDKYACVGSGAEIAIGVLEAEYKEGIGVNEARDVIKKAVKSAVARDVGSGDGLDILTITKEGCKEEFLTFS